MEKDDQHTGLVVSFKDTQNKKKKFYCFFFVFFGTIKRFYNTCQQIWLFHEWKDEWMESKLLLNIMWTPVVVIPWVDHIDIIAFVKRQV